MLDTTVAAGPYVPTVVPSRAPADSLTAAVVGLGYVGLAQAVALCRAGFGVVGYDVAASVRDAIRAGSSPVDTVESGQLTRVSHRLRVADTIDELRAASALIVCVPTPLDASGHPDLTPFRSAVASIAAVLRPGQLVCVESTVHPGATRAVALPMLQATGLVVGRDFNLAYAPERINPGGEVSGIPRVVGGATATCARRAAELYSTLGAPVHLTASIEVAEAAKMLENAYRLVNVSFVNEFAAYCSAKGIDTREVIAAAATKPFGFAAFHPSAGAGGHCIAVDPVYLLDDAQRSGTELPTLRSAVVTNHSVPSWIAARARGLLEREGTDPARARVLVLGLSYKPDVSDTRNSAAKSLVRRLRHHFGEVLVHDPYVACVEVDGTRYRSVADLDRTVAEVDLVVVAQRHAGYTDALLASARRICHCDGGVAGPPSPRPAGSTAVAWGGARPARDVRGGGGTDGDGDRGGSVT